MCCRILVIVYVCHEMQKVEDRCSNGRLRYVHIFAHAHLASLLWRKTKANEDWFDSHPTSVLTLRWPPFRVHILVIVNTGKLLNEKRMQNINREAETQHRAGRAKLVIGKRSKAPSGLAFAKESPKQTASAEVIANLN